MLRLVASSKVKMINVRLTERMHEDFKIACELRGASMSSLMHQFVVRTIREEKELSPHSFDYHEQIIHQAGGVKVAPRSQSPGIPMINTKTERRRVNDVPKKKNKRVG